MTEKISVPIVQFYIEHACNLACVNCLSFNNFAIRGRYSWENNRASTLSWAERILVEDLTIIGGEPLLHPEIDQWVTGVRELFPAVADFKVCTNGTRLDRMEQSVLERWHDLGVILEIHCHSLLHWDRVWQVLYERFPEISIETFTDRPALHSAETRVFLGGRLLALVRKSMNFLPNSIHSISEGRLQFYETDSDLAHSSCAIRECHYIVGGLMYKCGVIAAGCTANNLAVEPRARKLFDSYLPIAPDDPNLSERLTLLRDTVPQCSLCPEFGSVDRPEDTVPLELLATKPRLG